MRKLMKKADAISENLDKTLVEVKNLAANVNVVVSDNKTRIDNIAANLETTAVNFKEFSEDIKQHPWKLLMKGK
jgi:ABC-type transporter Mla subunit MlaD